jgi:hypothetical protein
VKADCSQYTGHACGLFYIRASPGVALGRQFGRSEASV